MIIAEIITVRNKKRITVDVSVQMKINMTQMSARLGISRAELLRLLIEATVEADKRCGGELSLPLYVSDYTQVMANQLA